MKTITEPEKLDLKSHSIADDKRAALLALFPEARTEGGKLDLDKLKLALGEAVDTGRERYGMNWPGKADCFAAVQAPSMATLRPVPEESVAFDSTQNLIIEGDNLQVLKLLQKGYQGKVKMIYIDPPYNTGKDFIYPDNYTEDLHTYLQYTGQVDAEGRKWGTGTDTDGRFHSKWLNMMYPRLYLARNLLREDGVVFISLDEKEITNLRRLLDDVFGEENLLGNIIWKGATDNNPTQIAVEHEYIICFAKDKLQCAPVWKNSADAGKDLLLSEFQRLQRELGKEAVAEIQKRLRQFVKANKEAVGAVSHYDRIDGRGLYTGSRKVHNPNPGGYFYDVPHDTTGKPCVPPVNGYRYPENKMKELLEEKRILFGEDENQIIQIKEYLEDFQGKLSSVIHLDSRAGSNELTKTLGTQKVFNNPKPTALLTQIFDFVLKPGDTVLDFFAGSGSTGHAVLDMCRADRKERRFILVQLPEKLDPAEKNDKTAIEFCKEHNLEPTIASITKERVRRVIKKLEAEHAGKLQLEATGDLGFRVYKLAESNFKPWNAEVKDATALGQQMKLHVHHILDGRTDQDLFTEILMKSGFQLTTPVEHLTLEGLPVYDVNGGELLVCLAQPLTHDALKAMAKRKPQRAVCLDAGFADNDQLKANAVQLFKGKGVVFKTV